jgi:FtsP/CotA-like multicopper oxidase with cupredoxin domain
VSDRARLLVACVATLAIVAPLGWLWQHSRLASTYDVTTMGYADLGGGASQVAGAVTGHDMAHMGDHGEAGGVSVRDLVVDPDRKADVEVQLVARQQPVRLASGRTVQGYTLNGRSPGPTIRATVGQLVQVHLVNAGVPAGITLHWHGVDVPNAEDGVAGITQDAVPDRGDFTYRFVVSHAGTFWYHSHQVSHEQVVGGLLGALVVEPRHPERGVQDVIALSHLYDGIPTIDGREGAVPVEAPVGQRVRVRVINTDNGPVRVWSSDPYRAVAVDGTDVHEPTTVSNRAVTVTAGGRVDLELTVPKGGARVQVGGGSALLLGPKGAHVSTPAEPPQDLDLLSYGSPAALGFDASSPDRRFRYAIGRRPGFVNGKPGLWWSVNGHLWPHLPMFVVDRGDVVQVTISNSSGDVHPMHLHGHHAVVLSRDGVKATGSPWWFDSLNVKDGETFVVAFVADNPGIWMDHCHNLKHAQQGLVTHLMYEGVTTPYRVGHAGNEPE